jgi:ribosomal protein S18 acetylase RimI-like enzyme
MNIQYSVIDEDGIDIVAPLWKKLYKYHGKISRHFGFDFPDRKWISRKNELLHEASDRKIRVDLANDTETSKLVGYCISSVKRNSTGEIDSIFIESDYRRCGIGNTLIDSALDWLKTQEVKRIIVQVMIGNEEAHPFYNRHGFLPRTTVMMRIDENDTSRS